MVQLPTDPGEFLIAMAMGLLFAVLGPVFLFRASSIAANQIRLHRQRGFRLPNERLRQWALSYRLFGVAAFLAGMDVMISGVVQRLV